MKNIYERNKMRINRQKLHIEKRRNDDGVGQKLPGQYFQNARKLAGEVVAHRSSVSILHFDFCHFTDDAFAVRMKLDINLNEILVVTGRR